VFESVTAGIWVMDFASVDGTDVIVEAFVTPSTRFGNVES
jgi:hypothetical protein